MVDRESMDVDVVVVGAGPSGLATAIRLKQLADASGSDLSIVVLEKAREVGAQVLSGAVIDPSGLAALFPDWKQMGAPLMTEVTSDDFRILTASRAFTIPGFLMPPLFSNHGNFIASLGDLCRWLGERAQAMGIDIFPGFAATELLFDDTGAVCGVATGDMGVDKAGAQKPGYAAGMELRARYTVIAEGARGSLAKELMWRFDLDSASEPQKYGLGIKEIWQVDPSQHRPGHVEHTLGWPLENDTGGGGFIYHADNHQVFVGFVVHLNYANPKLSPFDEMQRFKTHPHVAALLEGGKRIGYGARAMTSGGWQSIPELAFPGGALVGCSAGFMNVPRIKGSHNAILSGLKVAEAMFEALAAGRGNDLLSDLRRKVVTGAIEADLYPVRNAKPLLPRFGTMVGMLLAGLDLWTNTLLRASLWGTLKHGKPDHACLKAAHECRDIAYPRPDGKLTFDRSSSVFLSNIAHDEDQPVHLKLADPRVPIQSNLPVYGEPARLYCPAGVYEVTRDQGNVPVFRINAANCVHCKTCDIKDPAQNITWVPPEGGSGPNYSGM